MNHTPSPIWASLVAQMAKNPSAMWETWVQSLGWEDPLEKRMPNHSSILPWRFPWIVHKKLDTTERLSLSFTFCPNVDFVNTSLLPCDAVMFCW